MNILDVKQINILNGLWQKAVNIKSKKADFSWHEAVKVLYQLNIGMEETIQYLYYNKPSFEVFLTWVESKSTKEEETTVAHGQVLSADDLLFWEQNGYIVIKQAVTEQQCIDAKNAIWQFLDASEYDENSWYKPHPAKKGLMVVFTEHEALQRTRNSARIRSAYEQLYNSTDIYKTIDKVSFNPPETNKYKFMGSSLHWDVSLALPIPYKLQGLLYLNDVSEEGGAFQCVPGFHLQIADWMDHVPTGVDPRSYAISNLKPVSVAGSAGDFIIWHQALPHCASPNKSKVPRMVQYLTYLPNNLKEQDKWI
ncbi:MAG: phytanoyl-CoA dioxygenase family protein [Bacteroidota bacterium]